MPLSVRSSRSFRTPSLWADREFLKLWVGQSASQFGVFVSQVTVPLVAVVSLGAGAAQVGVLRAVQQVPILLLSLFVGVLVDRWRSRTVMMYADLGRALVLGAVPLGWVLGLPFLYAVALAVGVFSVCFDVANMAALPRLVSRDQLAQGNSMLETTRSIAQICGPAVGGVLVSLLSAPIAVLVGAGLFGVSSVSVGRMRTVASAGVSGGMVRQIRAGWGSSYGMVRCGRSRLQPASTSSRSPR